EGGEGGNEGIAHDLRGSTAPDRDQESAAALAFHQRRDRRPLPGADDEIALLTLLLRPDPSSGVAFRSPSGSGYGSVVSLPLDGSLGMAARCPLMARPLIENCDTDRWVRTCRRGHR